jgi:hypothetical protein
MMRRLSLATACAVLVVPTTPSSAQAVTGSWAGGVLTVTAAPGDGHVDIDVYDNRGDELDVTTSPVVDLSSSGCQYVTGAGGSGWVCYGGSPSRVVLDGGDGSADLSVNAYETTTEVEVTAGADGGTIEVDATSAMVTGRSARDVVSVRGAALHAELHDGEDLVSWTETAVYGLVSLGAGNDELLVTRPAVVDGAMPSVTVQGGGGSDLITAGGRRLRAYGGPGDDRFLPDATTIDSGEISTPLVMKRDVVDGGPGVDTVVLANPRRSGPVRVTLDGRADDGEPGEHDNYGADVENVVVSRVPAVVVGNRLDNRIELLVGGTARGGRGDDVLLGGSRLVGGRGHDQLLGGSGTSLVLARDGVRDVVRCVSRHTVVHADRLDLVADSCRHVVLG